MSRFVGHAVITVALTLLTQLGGLAWLIALFFKWRLPVFLAAYLALSVSAVFVAPMFGRVALDCHGSGPLAVQSWFYCAFNRHYVEPEMRDVLRDLAADMNSAHPGTTTLVLDAGFPFIDGFPLLPHLSHDDGGKADIAFYYRDGKGGYLPGRTKSPLGYFAFEQGQSACPDRFFDLRWNLHWLQPVWPDWDIEPLRMRHALDWLIADPRVGKVFIEPHLAARLSVSADKLRFQGCAAARHDDHIHIQL